MSDADLSAWRTHRARDEDAGVDAALLIFERILPALAVNVPRIRSELVTTLARCGVAEERRTDIALVATEAATNAVVHAYANARPGPLYAAAALDGDALSVCICDGGHGMRPRSDSAGLGLGMALMSRLADELRISSTAGMGGTCVTAIFEDAVGGRNRHRGRSTPAGDRGAFLQLYVEGLRVGHAALAEESDALLAEAAQAVAHGRKQLRIRAERKAAGARTTRTRGPGTGRHDPI